MTKAERAYLSRVAEIGCILCIHLGYGETGAQIHHRRTGTGLTRSIHGDAMPLCIHHHTGPVGIHGMGRRAWEVEHGVTELELLAETKRLMGVG